MSLSSVLNLIIENIKVPLKDPKIKLEPTIKEIGILKD
tara:strand:+ start:33 stop:146 length:114 start_codon:yes stop_codon:yes gene_type:complete